MIKIIVAGFKGRMGSTATQMVLETADFELVVCMILMKHKKLFLSMMKQQFRFSTLRRSPSCQTRCLD